MQHLMSIVLFLYRRGRCKKTEVYNHVSRTNNMPRKIARLVELNIVEEAVDVFDNNTKYLQLTESGRSIAVRLDEIEMLFNGNVPEERETNHSTPETVRADVTSGKT